MNVGWSSVLRSIVVLALLSGVAPSHAQNRQETPASATGSGLSTEAPAPLIASLRIVDEEGHVVSESPSGLSVQPGKPLNRQEVADSVRALYRTGDYADIRAVTFPVPGGLRLDFVVREQLFFNQVTIVGLVAPPTEASAIAAMQLSLGQPYRKEAVDEGLDRLRDSLQDEGLYEAQVSFETVPHLDTRQMDIIVHIKSGPRAHLGQITLKNGTEYGDSQLLARLKMKVGTQITSARVQKATGRVRNFLVKKGHLNARASLHRGTYNAAKKEVPVDLEVTEGPRVQIALTGAKFSSGDLKKLVPVYQEGAVDTDLLEEGKRNIRERLERQGYFDAEVDYSTQNREPVPGAGSKGLEQLITYRVERGPRHKFLRIEITGNHYFGTELLRSRLQISVPAFAAPARFSRRLLEADRLSMLNLYISNGFLDAKVEAQALDNFEGKEGNLVIRFVVQEGPQTRVASLAIEGVHAFKQDDLLAAIGSTPGQPYSDFNVATDRDNILALYFNEGFPDAQFSATAEPVGSEAKAAPDTAAATPAKNGENKKDQDPNSLVAVGSTVRLVYHIQEGPQIRVRQILVAGYVHTRPGVIRREIRMRPEAPLREGDVVESQRRLYNLGVFNRVTIEPQNPSGSDPDKDIVVLVEEARRYTIAYGGGFEVQRLASTANPTTGELQAAIRGILEISKLNLTGRGDSLSLKLRGSTIEDRALLGYSDPDTFGNSHLTFQMTAYTEKTQDINTFTEMRYEGSTQISDQLTPRTSLIYRYTFRKVLVSNLNEHISPEEIPLFNAPTLVSLFGVTWVRDARDNPADATKGNFNSADFGIADTSIGSSASFLRISYQNSTYHPLKNHFGFARSIRIGILEPYRDTASLAFPPQTTLPLPNLIPLPERLFAGGGTSLRGFALNQAGPRDPTTGFPVGGQALLILNQEFRFPMRLPYIGNALSGAFFYDGGNVYSRLGRITFRSYSPEPIFNPANKTQCLYNCTNELNYFSHTVGLGLRYATPVGPIRIDLGYQLNRPSFVAPICPTGASTCQQGQNGFQATRLPGFQIFFNLGSTF